MELLEGPIREYEWGSTTSIPELLGRPATGRPAAELWLGAHPSAPALVGPAREPLDRLIAADPQAALGPDVARRFGTLPFLFKVLAADEPLSLQAHPSTAQAEAGFAHEEAQGIPVDGPERSYRDRHHKPELICALTEFRALCGLRDPLATLAVLDTIPTPVLDPVRTMLADDPSPEALVALLDWLLSLSGSDAESVVRPVVEACAHDGPPVAVDERAVVSRLGARYPDDPAVVVALLLNHIVLAPGEALFLGAGNLHAYLGGTGVEVMANSDNVLRGGLTSKPVDVAGLLAVVDPRPVIPEIQRPKVVDGVARYDAPVPEFSLTRHEIDGSHGIGGGPAVVLCTAGSLEAGGHALERGRAAWIAAADTPVTLGGTGTVFRATVGDLAPR